MRFNPVTKEIFSKFCNQDTFQMQKISNDELKNKVDELDNVLFYLINDDGSKYFILENSMEFLYIPEGMEIDQNQVEITLENYEISKISDTTPYIKNEFMRGDTFMYCSSCDYENGTYRLRNKLFNTEEEFGLMSERSKWNRSFHVYFCDSTKQKLPPFCNKLSNRLGLFKLILNEKGQKYQKSNI